MPGKSDSPPPNVRSSDTFAGGVAFPPTQWSMVWRMQRKDADLDRAMNEFCGRYWYPIYAHLRSRGFSRSDAEDITQDFFLKAVKGDLIQSAEQTRGKLRSFLLGALNRHLADHLRHENAAKRGGRAIVLPIECYTAEERYSAETTDRRDPESLFMTAWARSLMDRVSGQLRKHYADSGRGEQFEVLQPFISLEGDESSYTEIARKMDTSEPALRLLVFRMRKRFGKLLREEIAETVETAEEVEEELAWLHQALRGNA